jgi:hypothetical protein
MADSFSGARAAFVTTPLHPREVLSVRIPISENIYFSPRACCPIANVGWETDRVHEQIHKVLSTLIFANDFVDDFR